MLKAISRSTFDLRTVLDTLLQSAVKLRSADQGTVAQRKGDTFYRSVSYGFSPVYHRTSLWQATQAQAAAFLARQCN